MQNQQLKEFYCYRRDLAQYLFCRGFRGARIVNCLYMERPAWQFEITPSFAITVDGFYKAQGIPTPRVIVDYLAAIDADGEEGQARA